MKKEIKIALTAIVALVLTFFGMNFLKGTSLFVKQHSYYVNFLNVSGLDTKTPVYADGVKVGYVGRINYDYNHVDPTSVELLVDQSLRIPKGSMAEVASDLMGNTQVNILFANNPREKLNPGDTMQGSEGDGTVARLKAMIPFVEELGPRLDSIMTNLNIVLADESLLSTLHNVQTISENLAVTSRELNSLVTSLNHSVPGLVGKADNALDGANALMGNANEFTDKLAQVDVQGLESQAKGSLADMQTTLNEVQGTIASLNKTVADLRTMTTRINNGEGSLGLLLNDNQLYNNLTTTVHDADILVNDLKDHPKRYVHFSIFGKK